MVITMSDRLYVWCLLEFDCVLACGCPPLKTSSTGISDVLHRNLGCPPPECGISSAAMSNFVLRRNVERPPPDLEMLWFLRLSTAPWCIRNKLRFSSYLRVHRHSCKYMDNPAELRWRKWWGLWTLLTQNNKAGLFAFITLIEINNCWIELLTLRESAGDWLHLLCL